MDLFWLHQGQRFVWNREKAAANLKKHGISFEMACEVFLDPFVRIVEASTDHEERDAAIGLAEDWTCLYVVHILREGDAIRMISARPATAHERRVYEDND
jgi:uncharacterized DUF497 family protein